MLRIASIALSLAALAAVPSAAEAATVVRSGDEIVYRSGAAGAELSVGWALAAGAPPAAARVTFTDAGDTVTPGSGCDRGVRPTDTHYASCAAAAITQVRLEGEGGADGMTVGAELPGSLQFVLAGGPGDDRLRGASGRDTFSGGDGADRLFGGPGADTFDGGAGADRFEPDPRSDDLEPAAYAGDRISGGAGTDTVAYPFREAVMSLSLDGLANDGLDGEKDSIDADRSVENLEPGEGPVTVTLDDKDNRVVNGEGIYHQSPNFPWEQYSGMTVFAKGGDDHVETERLIDSVDAGAGDDYVHDAGGGGAFKGGEGDDVLTASGASRSPYGMDPGPGADRVTGAYTAYSLRLDDGEVDSLDCGGGGAMSFARDPADVVTGCDSPGQAIPATVEQWRVQAAAGQANRITVTRTGRTLRVTDVHPLETGSPCTRVAPTEVTCPYSGSPVVAVNAGDKDDQVRVVGDVRTAISGGPGHDTLTGGDGADRIDGGKGGDIIAGGGGTDTADYGARTWGVRVDLDGVRDDGGTPDGAWDNVKPDVENLIGSAGPDSLTGSPAANLLEGGAGGDLLAGLGGADMATYAGRTLGVTADTDGVRDDGNGDDGRLAAERDDVRPDVEGLTGGAAGDTLTALNPAAVNLLVGNHGDDRLKTRDGGGPADQVVCGFGTDRYDSDPADALDGCETPATLP